MPDEELDILLQDARPKEIPAGELPEDDPAGSVGFIGCPSPELYRVYINEQALRTMEGHAASFPEREVGGVLLGRRLQKQGKPFLLVEETIAGLKAEGTATTLTFTHETWAQISAKKDREFPGLQIVGWYHTHPGLGLFLSRDDLYIHRNFFREAWQIAMVVDPIARDRALFIWKDGAPVKDGGLRVFQHTGERGRLDQYLISLTPPPPPREVHIAANTPSAVSQNVSVRLVFNNASVNIFRILPGFLRRLFGVTDLNTAPRWSLKSIAIVILLALLVAVTMKWQTERQMFQAQQGLLAKQYAQLQKQQEEMLQHLKAMSPPKPAEGTPAIEDAPNTPGATADSRAGATDTAQEPAPPAPKPVKQPWWQRLINVFIRKKPVE